MYQLDSIPGLGHGMGMIHYLSGNTKKGNDAMCRATRTTTVMTGGIAGGLMGGLAGAYAGGAAGGLAFDSAATIATNKPQGTYEGVDEIIRDVEKGKPPIASTIYTASIPCFDALTGRGAHAKYGGQGIRIFPE